MRARLILSAVGLGVLSAAGAIRDARACGGCFHEPPQPMQSGTVVTDHRMIFSISPQQTTLYDQVEYSGSPASFAWVLPIHAPVTVGLSSDTVFQALERATATQIVGPYLPPCPQPVFCGCGGFASASAGGDASVGPSVNIISQQTVGPYETVQLQSTDPAALTAWLTANGYVIPADVQPIIATYVAEHFDFLALRLRPGQGIKAMRPVRVTAPGAGVSLPLRMVAAGTGSTVGITLWVIGDGRYEPKNFQSFIVSPAAITWDFSISKSDYSTVVATKEAALGNAAWQIESSQDQSPVNIESTVLQSGSDYVDTPPSDAGPGRTAAQSKFDDLAALFPQSNQTVRITRMRADLAHGALAVDLQLQASLDQTPLSNVYNVTQSVNAPVCPPVSMQTCPPCNYGSGFGSGSSGTFSGSSGAGAGGGGVGTGSGVAMGTSGSPGSIAGDAGAASEPDAGSRRGDGGGLVSCSAAPAGPGRRADGAMLFAGVFAMAAAKARARRRR